MIEEREEQRRLASDLQQRMLTLEGQLSEAQARIASDQKVIGEMQETCEVLKALINQERELYNDERDKLEDDLNRITRLSEAKIRLIRTKLLTLYDGDINKAQEVSIEEIIERLVLRLQPPRNNKFDQELTLEGSTVEEINYFKQQSYQKPPANTHFRSVNEPTRNKVEKGGNNHMRSFDGRGSKQQQSN